MLAFRHSIDISIRKHGVSMQNDEAEHIPQVNHGWGAGDFSLRSK